VVSHEFEFEDDSAAGWQRFNNGAEEAGPAEAWPEETSRRATEVEEEAWPEPAAEESDSEEFAAEDFSMAPAQRLLARDTRRHLRFITITPTRRSLSLTQRTIFTRPPPRFSTALNTWKSLQLRKFRSQPLRNLGRALVTAVIRVHGPEMTSELPKSINPTGAGLWENPLVAAVIVQNIAI